MADQALNIEELKSLLGDVFAPMIQAMNIEPVKVTADGATFHVPQSDFIVRTGDVVCGQALASIADTVGVLALFAHNAPQRFMTTVDMTTHFMRPIINTGLDINAVILSNGRRMATVRIEITASGFGKIAATTTCAYAYIEPEAKRT